MNKDLQNDMEKRMELALNMVDINVKAMSSFVDSQSKVLKEVITATFKGAGDQVGDKNPVESMERGLHLGSELQKKYTALFEENMNLIKKTGEEISQALNKSFDTSAPEPKPAPRAKA